MAEGGRKVGSRMCMASRERQRDKTQHFFLEIHHHQQTNSTAYPRSLQLVPNNTIIPNPGGFPRDVLQRRDCVRMVPTGARATSERASTLRFRHKHPHRRTDSQQSSQRSSYSGSNRHFQHSQECRQRQSRSN